ncbi:unnamed protein product [Gadus morhua 'NCC']
MLYHRVTEDRKDPKPQHQLRLLPGTLQPVLRRTQRCWGGLQTGRGKGLDVDTGPRAVPSATVRADMRE